MPVKIPKVPLYTRKETKKRRKKMKEKQKGILGYFDFYKEDLESENESDLDDEFIFKKKAKKDRESDSERDRESDYEGDRSHAELLSRRNHEMSQSDYEFVSRVERQKKGGDERDIEKKKEKEKEKRKKKAIKYIDLYLRMYFEKVLFLFGEITREKADDIVAKIFMTHITRSYVTQKRSHKRDVFLFINSTGGGLIPGLDLYNMMNAGPSDINTLCVGKAFSIASFVLAVGKNEKRKAVVKANIMLHQASVPSLKTESEKLYDDMVMVMILSNVVAELLAEKTGQALGTVLKDLKSGNFMSAEEAQIHGIIDCIVDDNNYKDVVKRLIQTDGKSKGIPYSEYLDIRENLF